jgi:anti-sigma regulatory factor (Ser/Thr protein kinase)
MSVIDSGRGLSETIGIPVQKKRENGGLGLIIIHSLMDEVRLDTAPDGGTAVHMSKLLDAKRTTTAEGLIDTTRTCAKAMSDDSFPGIN